MIGFWIFMLIIAMLCPLTMVIFGQIFLHHPPKDINEIYGYRTKRSKRSKSAWDFAHKYVGRLWHILGIILLPLSIIAMLFCFGENIDTVGIWGGIICGIQAVIMLFTILPTEIALKRKFN
jgi:uncharacterized membrane protein